MKKLILLVACILPMVTAHAQGRSAAQAAALEAQLQTAEVEGAAAAVRPGDEDLTCQQLQDEIVAAAQSPELQAALQPFAGQVQSDQAQVEQAQQNRRANAGPKARWWWRRRFVPLAGARRRNRGSAEQRRGHGDSSGRHGAGGANAAASRAESRTNFRRRRGGGRHDGHGDARSACHGARRSEEVRVVERRLVLGATQRRLKRCRSRRRGERRR